MHFDRPALVRTDSPHQRQPQAEPFAAPLGAPHEGLEHALLLIYRNPHAGVFDAEAAVLEHQSHLPVLGVVQGVAQQVDITVPSSVWL